MNIRAVVRWSGVSLAFMLVMMFVAGIFVGISQYESGYESYIIETGFIIMLLVVYDFIQIYVILFGAALVWAFGAWYYPVIEIGKYHNILLVGYGVCIGLISIVISQAHISVSTIEGAVIALSICAPRFIFQKLKPGAFAIVKTVE